MFGRGLSYLLAIRVHHASAGLWQAVLDKNPLNKRVTLSYQRVTLECERVTLSIRGSTLRYERVVQFFKGHGIFVRVMVFSLRVMVFSLRVMVMVFSFLLPRILYACSFCLSTFISPFLDPPD